MNPIEIGVPENIIGNGYDVQDINQITNEVVIYKRPYIVLPGTDKDSRIDILCRLKITDVSAGLHLIDCISSSIESISGWNPFKDMLEQIEILKDTVAEIKKKI